MKTKCIYKAGPNEKIGSEKIRREAEQHEPHQQLIYAQVPLFTRL
jgi:hypothetical protein